MFELNDYELLYQIKNYDEYAYYLMVEKYSRFIMSKIRSFGFYYNKDEFYQEGLIVLEKAISTFDDSYNKTFMRYFEKILINKFVNLRKKEKEQCVLYEDIYMKNNYVLEEMEAEYEINRIRKLLNDFEKEFFVDYFIENYSVEYLSNKYQIKTEKVYFTIRTIRAKIKKNML